MPPESRTDTLTQKTTIHDLASELLVRILTCVIPDECFSRYYLKNVPKVCRLWKSLSAENAIKQIEEEIEKKIEHYPDNEECKKLLDASLFILFELTSIPKAKLAEVKDKLEKLKQHLQKNITDAIVLSDKLQYLLEQETGPKEPSAELQLYLKALNTASNDNPALKNGIALCLTVFIPPCLINPKSKHSEIYSHLKNYIPYYEYSLPETQKKIKKKLFTKKSYFALKITAILAGIATFVLTLMAASGGLVLPLSLAIGIMVLSTTGSVTMPSILTNPNRYVNSECKQSRQWLKKFLRNNHNHQATKKNNNDHPIEVIPNVDQPERAALSL